ncbi:hypothetical protein [Tellurirhabdus rosea]|uniref:hypothetical protein n=1 Tax=Tellurirhabdus rosea TaxID=2674997 RepID=UPI002254F128|nr:hypothetical protein [Tellurirhabdus rosea]
MKKVTEIPSVAKPSAQVDAFAKLGTFYGIFRRLGLQSPNLTKAFDDIQRLKLELDTTKAHLNEFVERFSPLGWVLYETMSLETISRALQTAREESLSHAEKVLAESYRSEEIQALILSLSAIKAFEGRERLAAEALKWYSEKAYGPCVLLLLTLLDGFTSDLSPTNRGFFADSTDLYADDSIAGHESGLPALSRLLCATITKTTPEAVTIPYRHGILHGKILNYDNRINAAKLWGALFAIRDWQFRKKSPARQEVQITLKKAFQNYAHWHQTKKQIDNWQPRLITEPDYLQNLLAASSPDLPEVAVVQFFEHWKAKNYKDVGKLLANFVGHSDSKMAGRARQLLKGVTLLDYTLKQIKDVNLMTSHVLAACTYSKGKDPESQEIRFELLYVDGKDVTLRLNGGGRWIILDRCVEELIMNRGGGPQLRMNNEGFAED